MKKGQAPQSFIDGKLQKHDLRSRPPEERKRIAQMGLEARRKKKNEKAKLQEYMKELLSMKADPAKGRAMLKEMGFVGEDATNSALLMTILFKKGLSGDTKAIKQIIEMMDKLDIVSQSEDKRAKQSTVNINIQPVKSKTEINIEEKEREIMLSMDEDNESEDEWE